MTFDNRLVSVSVSLEDAYDRLVVATSLFESGMVYLDGTGIYPRSPKENTRRGLYLLDLYQQEVIEQLENIRDDIDWLKKHRVSTS